MYYVGLVKEIQALIEKDYPFKQDRSNYPERFAYYHALLRPFRKYEKTRKYLGELTEQQDAFFSNFLSRDKNYEGTLRKQTKGHQRVRGRNLPEEIVNKKTRKQMKKQIQKNNAKKMREFFSKFHASFERRRLSKTLDRNAENSHAKK